MSPSETPLAALAPGAVDYPSTSGVHNASTSSHLIASVEVQPPSELFL